MVGEREKGRRMRDDVHACEGERDEERMKERERRGYGARVYTPGV